MVRVRRNVFIKHQYNRFLFILIIVFDVSLRHFSGHSPEFSVFPFCFTSIRTFFVYSLLEYKFLSDNFMRNYSITSKHKLN